MIEQFLESNTKAIIIILVILGIFILMAFTGSDILGGLHIGGIFS